MDPGPESGQNRIRNHDLIFLFWLSYLNAEKIIASSSPATNVSFDIFLIYIFMCIFLFEANKMDWLMTWSLNVAFLLSDFLSEENGKHTKNIHSKNLVKTLPESILQ